MPRMPTYAASLLTGAILAGCGGSGASTPSTSTVTVQKQGGPAPIKAEFIKTADTLCHRFHSDIAPLQQKIDAVGIPTSTDEVHQDAALLRALASKLEDQAAELRKLQPPRGDEAIINQWLSTGEGGISLFRDLAEAFASQDASRIRILGQEVKSRSDRAAGIAQGYGFKVCGSGN